MGFGFVKTSSWDLGIALPKKILEICVRQFVGFGYMERERERERERGPRGVIEYIEKL